MKALTVQQPWAWAIVHGGKDVENRTQAWSYRGPLAIHAGARWSERGAESQLIKDAALRTGGVRRSAGWGAGEIIGVVDLVDVHAARDGCCESPWAETAYTELLGARARIRRDIVHLVLENAQPLVTPIPCRGALGLWTPPAEVAEQLQEAIT